MAVFLLPGCVQLTIAWANLSPEGPRAEPEILTEKATGSEISSKDVWEQFARPKIKRDLQRYIYGTMPDRHQLRILDQRIIDTSAFEGLGILSEYRLKAEVFFGDSETTTRDFYMNVVMPAGNPSAPVILIQTFCPRWDTMPHSGISRPEGARSCSGGFASGIMEYVFGRYIATPPLEMILESGYGVATIFPSEIVDDSKEQGLKDLRDLSPNHSVKNPRWGAIAAWAWGFSLMVDALEASDNVSSTEFISLGHSRYGKSALVAAAFDERISAVVAHQSGTGGASLNRKKKGESVTSITESYPHWFADTYKNPGGKDEIWPVDQHQLLAIIAPRPILLGNARRDVWSDPNGAFRAAMGADPVYELYGLAGLDQSRLDAWHPSAELAFWIRPGTHGVVREDWPAFIAFLDQHFIQESGGVNGEGR